MRDVADKEDRQDIIVARDKWTKMTWSMVVECHGNGDTKVAKELAKFIDELGYSKIERKSDGEPALMDVVKRVKQIRAAETIPRNPPAHDPQSNGVAERAVQEVKGQLRKIKIALDRRIGKKVDPKSAIMQWMVPHASDVINKFLVGADGRTAYYRLRNKNFKQKVVEFGEIVKAKPLRKATRKRSLRPRVVDAISVGMHPRSNEHRVVLLDGGPAIKVRTIFRVPDSAKWSAAAIEGVAATPRKPNPKDEDQEEPEHAKDTRGLHVEGDG